MEEGTEERAALLAKLTDAESKLVSAEQSKSQAESEAEKATLEQQFTEQVAEYKVRRKKSLVPFEPLL